VLLDRLFAGQDHGAGTIADTRGIAGRDHAIFLERGGQLGETLHAGLGPRVLIDLEALDALSALELDRRHLGLEVAGLLRRGPGLLAAHRVGVGLFAGDAVLLGEVLGGDRHRTAAEAVGERGPQGVLHLEILAQARAPASVTD